MLNPASEVLWVNDVIVTLEKLEVLSKVFRVNQVSIENGVAASMVGRNDSVIVHDCVAAEWRNPVQPPDVMQNRIHRVLQYWTYEAHPRRPGNIVTTHSALPPTHPLGACLGCRPESTAQQSRLGNPAVSSSN
jgi:hypothetical protein